MKLAWFAAAAVALLACGQASADADKQRGKYDDKFRQLEVDLPSPTPYRAASGAPGESYWQQQADYVINAALDEAKKRITATGTINYRNNSAFAHVHLALQLDQNIFKQDSAARRSQRFQSFPGPGDSVSINTFRQLQSYEQTPHGFEIGSVTDGSGKPLRYINDTMMRIDLPAALAPKATTVIKLAGRSTSSTTTCSAAGQVTNISATTTRTRSSRRSNSAACGVHGLHGLAAQAVPRAGRVHARVREL